MELTMKDLCYFNLIFSIHSIPKPSNFLIIMLTVWQPSHKPTYTPVLNSVHHALVSCHMLCSCESEPIVSIAFGLPPLALTTEHKMSNLRWSSPKIAKWQPGTPTLSNPRDFPRVSTKGLPSLVSSSTSGITIAFLSASTNLFPIANLIATMLWPVHISYQYGTQSHWSCSIITRPDHLQFWVTICSAHTFRCG